MSKLTCRIQPNPICYDVEIQSGLLADQKILIPYIHELNSRIAVISNEKVSALYGQKFCAMLFEHGLKACLFTFKDGEQHKTRQTKEQLEDQMLENELGRDTCLIALGGGVTMDIGGYLAATYCRGIPLIMVPTSLLGMVDACIGGKAGVNAPQGKNLLGSIYQPKKIFIDPSTLHTLPVNEFRNGLVEMTKHGLIADKNVFEYLETHCTEILALDNQVLEKAIYESCKIKMRIIEQDEKELGKRRLLNFGHTIGHALEQLSRFQLSHGEAIAIGILVESYLSVQLGYLDKKSLKRIHTLLSKFGLPLKLPGSFSFECMQKAMVMDKKSVKGIPRFVLLKEIGTALDFNSTYCTYIDDAVLKNAIQWMNNDLCCH